MLNEKTQPLPFSATESESEQPPPRSAPRDRFLFALFWTLAVMGVIGLLSVLLFRELDRRKDAEQRVVSAQSALRASEGRLAEFEEEVAALEADLASARADLKPWRARTARRGDALRSTRGVIALVSPLGETYDDVVEVLTAMDADREAIAAAARALERDVDSLTDYLRRTEEDALSKRELRKRATTLLARLAALRSARVSLVEAQSGYADAAGRLESSFDRLTSSVTSLRKEITKAMQP